MPKYRISLPEAPGEEYEVDAPEGADFDEIENEIRQQRTREKAQLSAKAALDKAIKPVGIDMKSVARAGGSPISDNETALGRTVENLAGPVSGAFGGGILGALKGGLRMGLPGAAVGAAFGALPAVFGQRTTPADAIMNMIPSGASRLPGLARKPVEKAVSEVIPNATPYASAFLRRLANATKEAPLGAAEGLARGAAHRGLSGQDPSLDSKDALIGGAAGAIGGFASIKPIEATKKEQAEKYVQALSDQEKNLHKTQISELAEAATIKERARLLAAQTSAEARRKKALSQTQTAIEETEKESAPLRQQLNTIEQIEQKVETLTEETIKRRSAPLKGKITRAQKELEGISAIFSENPTPANADKLRARQAKLTSDITAAQQQLEELKLNPASGNPKTPVLQTLQKTQAKIGPGQKERIQEQLAPADEKLAELRPQADLTAKEIAELEKRILKYNGNVKPNSLTKSFVEDYLATTPVAPGQKQTQAERLFEITSNNAGRQKERQELVEKIQRVSDLFGEKRKSAVLAAIAADFTAHAYMAAPTGVVRATLAGLGGALKAHDSELAAQANKTLSKVVGSKLAGNMARQMQTFINMTEEPEKGKEEGEKPFSNTETPDSAGSRQALLEAIAQQEGYYDDDPGNRPRRNKNPGNLRGKEGFYMYPSDDAGWAALGDLLDKNRGKTLRQYISQHAPPEDNNDTEAYIRNTIERLKKKGISVSEDTLLEELLVQ